MAGKICPSCGEQTLWNKGSRLECSKCGYRMNIPANQGMGGKGRKCPNCGKNTLFNGRCSNCGAKEQF